MSLLPPAPAAWLKHLRPRQQLQKPSEIAREGIWVIDVEGVTVFANEQMARILRCGREELLGAHLFEFMDADGRAICARHLQQRKHGKREQHEFRFRAKNGEEVWTQLSISPLRDQAGNYAGLLAMATERRGGATSCWAPRAAGAGR